MSHIRYDFRGKKRLLNIKSVFRVSLQILSEIFFILRRNERDIIINIRTSTCKVPAIILKFQWNLNILDRVFKGLSDILFYENAFGENRVFPSG